MTKVIKTKDLRNTLSKEISAVYDINEAASIAFLLMEAVLKVTHTDLMLDNECQVSAAQGEALRIAMGRLLNHEPVQYVIRKASFYEREFSVNSSVLIPRRETEELVHLIINDHPGFGGTLLDIGTGSGCIPITLRLELPSSKVEAIDISDDALAVAKENASTLGAAVTFHQQDVLDKLPLPNSYDIIVSNPPYVTNAEKTAMRSNVLEHEPHLALFVEDCNPLLFYTTITEKAKQALNPKGMLYFEINEQFGQEVAQAMTAAGFANVVVIEDMQGKDRIVKGTLG